MRLAVLTLALALLLAACEDETADDAPATVVAASPTVEVTATASPPPDATATASPPATAVPGEPVASTASIPLEDLGIVEFVQGETVLGALPLEVPPREEYSIGLSGRIELGERGMLFDYGRPDHDGPFWMKNTHIDLDIAFVDGDGRIATIRRMQAESLDLVYSEARYQWAIEAPAGWYAAHGIEVGAEARFLFDTPSALATP